MEEKKYEEAQAAFTDLGGYQDAEEMVVECQLNIDYNAAKQMMDSGKYAEAQKAFEALGSFSDASMLAVECRNTIDYNAATQMMDNGDYAEAKAAFVALGSFSDSGAMAEQCQSEIDYGIASDTMESGEYAQACQLFTALGSFRDSVALAEECSNWVDYEDAVSLMDADNYAAALVLLNPLAEIEFEDSTVLKLECTNTISYTEADKAFEDGLYYTAYKIFQSIWDFRDSDSRADLCIQDLPSTGQIYRNPDFSGSAAHVKFKTPKDDERPTLLKIYTPDEVHVSSVFVRSGGTSTIKLPAGTYMVKTAYGVNWFGPEEMFGDENAVYQLLIFPGNSTTYEFRRNYIVTITLRSVVDGNVGTENQDRGGF